jgi:hypothetical protein
VGGNALKNTKTRRYNRDEYLVLEADVIEMFKNAFPKSRIEAIKAYRTKESFGDMDILIEVVDGDIYSSDWCHDLIKQTFKPNQIAKNSNVVSFDYREFQIDAIFTPSNIYQSSIDYFAWNDLGNFTGRLAHKLGFKYGHNGLVFVFRDGNYMFREIPVSTDTKAIMEFLDLDFDVFSNGFNTMEEVFKFASSSKYFNKHMYAEENRNHKSNIRDRKRKNYHDFVVWMNNTPNLPEYPWEDMKEQGGPKYKDEFIKLAYDKFPQFEVKHKQALVDYENHKIIKEKYNGEFVNDLTGLMHKELGEFMAFVKNSFNSRQTMDEFVLLSSKEELTNMVLTQLKNFKG